jgi:hypothetical protein
MAKKTFIPSPLPRIEGFPERRKPTFTPSTARHPFEFPKRRPKARYCSKCHSFNCEHVKEAH